MHAAIYLRISSDPTGEQLGVTRQREDCERLCAEKGWTPVEYVDNDISASSGKRRPSYERMLADIRDSKLGAVVCWDLDRLHRRPIELEAFMALADDTTNRPPAGLGKRGRAVWRDISASYVLDPAEVSLLTELCRTLDEIDRLSAALAGVELVVTGSTGQPRPHPLLDELREHRKVADKLAASLALPVEGEQAGRRRSAQAKQAVNQRWRRAGLAAVRSSPGGA